MRERKPLKPNTELCFVNHAGGAVRFVVCGVVGEGGSCLVYSGYYVNNAGARNTVRIKECYPYRLHLTRQETGELVASDDERDSYEEYKSRVRKSFDIANELHEAAGLVNATSNVFDVYEANNTIYIVSSYVEGSTLSRFTLPSLEAALRVVKGVAESLDRLHRAGWLYLDVKPENILLYDDAQGLIQLFDFDSVIPMNFGGDFSRYRMSYSNGFAPIEQKSGDMSCIGSHTDVYSVGALLFYLLFGRTPRAMDCGADVEYDFQDMKWSREYHPKVYGGLAEIFHNTLRAYYKDRYQSMSEVAHKLSEIEEYAGRQVVFANQGCVPACGAVVGRTEEIAKLTTWYKSGEKVIFLTGMGGIGKSTIVRKFIRDSRDEFDYVIYLQFKGSIIDTICDDMQLLINGYERDDGESREDYFSRKIRTAKRLTAESDTLLVIDNFDGRITGEFVRLMSVNWHIIAVTRSDMRGSGYVTQRVGELRDEGEICRLFEENMRRSLNDDERKMAVRIAESVDRHTLIMALVARQIDRSCLSMAEAAELVNKCGWSGIAPEKVDYTKDGAVIYERVSVIIRDLYDVSGLSEVKKNCLKLVSLFDDCGVAATDVRQVLHLKTLDEINELKDAGWVECADRRIRMHPLIRETIRRLTWNDECADAALEEMQLLHERIEELGDLHENAGLRQALSEVKSVLCCCTSDVRLSHSEEYNDLLCKSVIASPRDCEDYILRGAEQIFSTASRQKPYNITDVCDYVVFLLCQREDFAQAESYLRRAEAFASECKDDYVWGKYYDMLMDYYDAELSGAYWDDDTQAADIVDSMLRCSDLAIKHMSRSGHEAAGRLTVKYTLGKAMVLIRNRPGERTEIRRLIGSARRLIDSTRYGEGRHIFYMARAWYYTLCEEDCAKAVHNIEKARRTAEKIYICDLDRIDYFYIPAANMMLESGDADTTIKWLEEACDLCGLHEDTEPYTRKKGELLSCIQDTYNIINHFKPGR